MRAQPLADAGTAAPRELFAEGSSEPPPLRGEPSLDGDPMVARLDPSARASVSPGSTEIAAPSASAATPSAGPQTVSASIDARGDVRVGPQVEAAIEHFAEAREAARSIRPEVTLRHAEFGLVSMRLDASGSELRAMLAARDPGFVPAVQAALAERAVTGAEAGAQAQSHLSQRGHDTHGQGGENGRSGSGHNGTAQGHGTGQDGARDDGAADPRYGMSPGSDQASPSPYGDQYEGDEREAAIQPSEYAATDRALRDRFA